MAPSLNWTEWLIQERKSDQPWKLFSLSTQYVPAMYPGKWSLTSVPTDTPVVVAGFQCPFNNFRFISLCCCSCIVKCLFDSALYLLLAWLVSCSICDSLKGVKIKMVFMHGTEVFSPKLARGIYWDNLESVFSTWYINVWKWYYIKIIEKDVAGF